MGGGDRNAPSMRVGGSKQGLREVDQSERRDGGLCDPLGALCGLRMTMQCYLSLVAFDVVPDWSLPRQRSILIHIPARTRRVDGTTRPAGIGSSRAAARQDMTSKCSETCTHRHLDQ